MLPVGKSVQVEAESTENQTATLRLAEDKIVTYNLATLFEFRNDLASANASHSALQQFWETLACDLIFRAREFEEDGFAKWWAHSRRYARYVLRTMQARETIDMIKDWVIILFSSDVSEASRRDYAIAAWKGFLIERHGSDAAADKAIAAMRAPNVDQFAADMYAYVAGGWPYETVMATKRMLDEQAEKVRSIAKTLQDRSFKMHEFTELEKAKFGNVGPMTVDELVDQVAFRVKQKISSGIIDKAGVDEVALMASVKPHKT